MSCLLITNKERGKKPGETDIDFWDDVVNSGPEPFTMKDLAIWGVDVKPFGITSIIKGGPGSGIHGHTTERDSVSNDLKLAIESYYGGSTGSNALRAGWEVLANSGSVSEARSAIETSLKTSGAIMSSSDREDEIKRFSDPKLFSECMNKISNAPLSQETMFRRQSSKISVKTGDIIEFKVPVSFTPDSDYASKFKGSTTIQVEPMAPALSIDKVLGVKDSNEYILAGSFKVVDSRSDGSKHNIKIKYNGVNKSIVPKGGSGSGNFGHGGRPGEVGGSGEGGGEDKVSYGSPLEGNTQRDSEGKLTQVNGEPLPEHVQSVYIPPGWKEVTFNPDPNASMVAKGLDEKGRPVYAFRAGSDAESAEQKWARVSELDKVFDSAVHQNREDMKSTDDSLRDKATCWNLVSQTGIRAGSEDDTKAEKQAYGATTLLGRHVVATENGVELQYVGKKGVDLTIPVTDPKLVSSLLERAKTAGSDGQLFKVSDSQLLAYTKKLAGDDFMTKDLRTLVGTRTAYEAVKSLGGKIPNNEKEYKQMVKEVATSVSKKLGNSAVVAVQSYIDPTVFASWQGNWKGRELWQG